MRWRCRRGSCFRRSAPAAAGRSRSPARSAAHAGRNCSFLEKPWCAVMGTPFSHDMGEGFLSAEAIANPPPFERARAAVAYTGVARRMVQALKYGDRTDLAPWMARWMLRAGAELVADADVVVPVPLHWRRFFSRRFNQSAELARAIAALSGKPFEPMAIKRVKVTRQQVGLGLNERAGQCPRRLQGAAGTRHRRARPAGAGGRRRLHDRRDRVLRDQGAEEKRRRGGRYSDLRARSAGGLPARRAGPYIGGKDSQADGTAMVDVTIYTQDDVRLLRRRQAAARRARASPIPSMTPAFRRSFARK